MKKFTRIIAAALAFVLIFFAFGCSGEKTPEITPKTVSAVDLLSNITAREVEGKVADETFASNYNDFALNLFREVYGAEGSDENLLLSPLSVMLALGMVANGAKGETAEEFAKLLGGGDITIDDLNRYLMTYADGLYSGENCKLELANSVWFRNAEYFVVLEEFLQNVVDYYDASVYAEPFDETTLENINNWVYNHTDGMIEKILDQISPDDMMFLINAVVFDAKWQAEYKSENVKKGKFTQADGKKVDVDMMTSTENIYFEDDLAVGFEKYYEGGNYGFVALLPKEGVSIDEYIAELDGERIEKLLSNPLPSTNVTATMPKFSFDYETDLADLLAALGLGTAFSGAADFSGISETVDLCISEVVHKTFIDVSESGTKAAAVTEIGMKATSVYIENHKVVTLDRPFVFMIVDNATATPIFVGTLQFVS